MKHKDLYFVYCKCCRTAFICHKDVCPSDDSTGIFFPVNDILAAIEVAIGNGASTVIRDSFEPHEFEKQSTKPIGWKAE